MVGNRLFTIGHSNRGGEEFIALLTEYNITAVADVRSSPYSSRNPQFNKDVLREALKEKHIDYVFLGEELGARRIERECYDGAVASYELIAKSPLFQSGINRIRRGLESHRIALMCAERDPLTCHRAILVCQYLKSDQRIEHILDHQESEEHSKAEMRLLKLVGLSSNDLFYSVPELIEQAYELQGAKIAYRAKPVGSNLEGDS